MEFDLEVDREEEEARRNFREVGWGVFEEELAKRLEEEMGKGEIDDDDDFEREVETLVKVVNEIIEEQVPEAKQVPASKRWWGKELGELKRKLNRSRSEVEKYRALPEHHSHAEARQLANKFKDTIEDTKVEHWDNYLEKVTGEGMWTLNKFISQTPGDGAASRLPTLQYLDNEGKKRTAVTNQEKTDVLAKGFFPERPADLSVERNGYPEPVDYKGEITEERVKGVLRRLKSFKASGPDGIPNVVWKECAETLAPQITRIFKAVYEKGCYAQMWKEWTTIVLKKPGKP